MYMLYIILCIYIYICCKLYIYIYHQLGPMDKMKVFLKEPGFYLCNPYLKGVIMDPTKNRVLRYWWMSPLSLQAILADNNHGH